MKLLAIIFISCMFHTLAFGQREAQRKGFAVGMSMGIANSNLQFPTENQTDTNLAINWKVGYMISPKLALLVNGAVSTYKYDLTDRPRLRDWGGVFASAQYFATQKLWLLGGVGIGTDAPVFYDLKPENTIETKYYAGVGVISAVGYELYRKKNFALDAQVRVNYNQVNLPIGSTNGFTAALLVGINFY